VALVDGNEMARLTVFSLGDHGVNRTLGPLEGPEDLLLQAQNAVLERHGTRRALRKRAGLEHLAGGMPGPISALVLGGTVLPAPSGSPIDDDPDLDLSPYVNRFGALLDLVTMRCRLYLTAATTSVADNTPTTVSWTAEDYDIGPLHDLTTNPDRITIPPNGAGLYLVIGQVVWATSGSTKHRPLTLRKNGADYARSDGGSDDDGDALASQIVAVIPLVAGDYLQLVVEQDTGAALNLVGGSPTQTALTAVRIIETAATPLPRVLAFRSTNLSLTAGTPTLVPFDAEAHDTAAMHDTGVNTERLTVPADQGGLYLIEGQVSVQAPYVGLLTVELVKNGSQVLAKRRAAGLNAWNDPDVTLHLGGTFEMAAGDYVTLRVTEDPNPGHVTSPLLGASAPDLGKTWFSAARVG
jgi:hypothetical protein